MPQRARKKMQNNSVVARVKSGEVPEQKFEGECLVGIILKSADKDGNRESENDCTGISRRSNAHTLAYIKRR